MSELDPFEKKCQNCRQKLVDRIEPTSEEKTLCLPPYVLLCKYRGKETIIWKGNIRKPCLYTPREQSNAYSVS